MPRLKIQRQTLLPKSHSLTSQMSIPLAVNLYLRDQKNANLITWKVRAEPAAYVGWGNRVWLESEEIRKGWLNEEGPSGSAGVKIVEGDITELVAWERRWVTFEVKDDGGGSRFRIIVPRQWSRLGMVLGMQHYILRHWLKDTIPALPITAVTQEGIKQMRETSVAMAIADVF
jgi:hypothetical protein